MKDGNAFGYEYNLVDDWNNVRVTVKEDGSVIQRDGYYPFGLTFNSWHVSPKNNYLFQGQEHQELSGWDQFRYRNHDPSIGRFFNLDPLAEDYFYNSPYAFAENKIGLGIELEGLELLPNRDDSWSQKAAWAMTGTLSTADVDVLNQQTQVKVDRLKPEVKMGVGAKMYLEEGMAAKYGIVSIEGESKSLQWQYDILNTENNFVIGLDGFKNETSGKVLFEGIMLEGLVETNVDKDGNVTNAVETNIGIGLSTNLVSTESKVGAKTDLNNFELHQETNVGFNVSKFLVEIYAEFTIEWGDE